MVGTRFLNVPKEFSQLHSWPVRYLAAAVVFNQLILIFQVSSCKSEHISAYFAAAFFSVKEKAVHLCPQTLCNFG